MGRYNKIFAGPVDMTKPQVRELPAGAAITPGQIITQSGATFVAAGATTTGKVYIAQENYIAMEGVDTAYATGDTVLGLELIPGMLYSAPIIEMVAETLRAAGTPNLVVDPGDDVVLLDWGLACLATGCEQETMRADRKSTRLNSSH
jgi:hypothetical protein